MLSGLTPSEVRERARTRVLGRLADKTLTPRALATDLGISRSGLYRLLACPEGVHGFIRDVRLDAAREALRMSVSRKGRILDVALAHGFATRHAFWRAYRIRFGHAPAAMPPLDVFPAMPSRGEPDGCGVLRDPACRAGQSGDVASRPPIRMHDGPG